MAEEQMSDAFRQAPLNPNKMFKQQQEAPQQAVDPSAAPFQQVAQSQQAPSPEPAPVVPMQEQAPAPAPQPTQQPVFQQPYVDPNVAAYYESQLQQMAQERDALRRDLDQNRGMVNAMTAELEEYQKLRRKHSVDEAMSNMDFSQLQTVDGEDAAQISRATLAAMQPQFEAMRQELEQQRQWQQQFGAQQQQQLTEMRQRGYVQQILQAHPDYYQLEATPAFRAFLNMRDGASSQTNDQRAAFEFRNGNPGYVIDMINRFKQSMAASQQQVMSVPPVQTAAGPAVTQTAQASPVHSLRELNDMFQTRQITQDEYRAQLKRLRESQQGV